MPVPKGAKYFRLYHTSAFMGGRLYDARALYLDEIMEILAFSMKMYHVGEITNCNGRTAFIIVYDKRDYLIKSWSDYKEVYKILEKVKECENKCI